MSQSDLLDCFRPVVTVSRIHCDCEGCTAAITIPNDIDESQAMAVARAAGWTSQLGTFRASHHCTKHSEIKR